MPDRSLSAYLPDKTRIVRIPTVIAAIEAIPIIGIERSADAEAMRQVGVRDEISAEGDEIRIAGGEDSSGGDKRPLEQLAKMLRGNRGLTRVPMIRPFPVRPGRSKRRSPRPARGGCDSRYRRRTERFANS